MTAKEMFEKLGYKLENIDSNHALYSKTEDVRNAGGDWSNFLWLLAITKCDGIYKKLNGDYYNISGNEIPAIQKQIEELGWEE